MILAKKIFGYLTLFKPRTPRSESKVYNPFNLAVPIQVSLLAVSLSACLPLAKDKLPVLRTIKPSNAVPIIVLPESSSPLVQALFEAPAVDRSFAAAVAVKAQVAIATTAKSSKVDFSGSTGLTGENNRSTAGTAAATITANRLLYDNGQTDRSILLRELTAQSASLEAEVVLDETLQEIIQAFGRRTSAKETIRIIDYHLGLYNAREDLVKSAVQAGVLSNSDYLELRSLKNTTLSERAQSELSIQRSESFLKNTLGAKYTATMAELGERHGQLKAPKFSMETSVQKELIDIRAAQLGTQIEIQKARNKPTAQFQTSMTNPQNRGADTTVFAGITIKLPIKDGGEAAARIDALSEELMVLDRDMEILNQNIMLAKKSWENFKSYHQIQEKLLLERKSISSERLAELGLLLKAGRSDIKELAKEILAGAQNEIALLQLKSEYLSQSLTATSVTNRTCGLLSLCSLIEKDLPENQ